MHFGSLIAALASYLQARQHHGQWYLRIDDIDPPREQIGASGLIIETLSAHGFHWEGPVQFQSQHTVNFEHALGQLTHAGHVFNCTCSRKQIAAAQRAATNQHAKGTIYPGTCRNKALTTQDSAIRFKAAGSVTFNDKVQGQITQSLPSEVGDFVIKRRDGLFSYQLANVVDDAKMGITEVVRGADLLDNTNRQLALIKALGLTAPEYAHVPVAVDENGSKLSKQTLAAPLQNSSALLNLQAAWKFLGQSDTLSCETINAFWQTAVQNWDLSRVPRVMQLRQSSPAQNTRDSS